MNFQQVILTLQSFWAEHGCIIVQPYDNEVGAGTFHPATFLRSLGPEPWNVAYVQPSRRPTDGRYGENPNRLQHYYQYQVILKPSPGDVQDLYLKSLERLGFDLSKHDVRFVEDDWESPTLGAWGLGWEVWLDGMEVTQFTYFQQVGGIDVKPVCAELTYGLERLSMYIQEKESVFDLKWVGGITYGEIHHQNEIQGSIYNFEVADVPMLFKLFDMYEAEVKNILSSWEDEDKDIAAIPVLSAYDYVLKCSHAFNLLDARGALSVTERTRFIGRVRDLARRCAKAYLEQREALGFPLLKEGVGRSTAGKAAAGAGNDVAIAGGKSKQSANKTNKSGEAVPASANKGVNKGGDTRE